MLIADGGGEKVLEVNSVRVLTKVCTWHSASGNILFLLSVVSKCLYPLIIIYGFRFTLLHLFLPFSSSSAFFLLNNLVDYDK
jgi:hypothetical protein